MGFLIDGIETAALAEPSWHSICIMPPLQAPTVLRR